MTKTQSSLQKILNFSFLQWATICPITISLAPYNKKQLTDLLTSRLKSFPHPGKLDEAPDFFRNFADIIIGTFFIVCRSFPQFLRVAQVNRDTVGIRLLALWLPEAYSYQTFISPLSEWSTLSRDHLVTGLFVHYSGHTSQ